MRKKARSTEGKRPAIATPKAALVLSQYLTLREIGLAWNISQQRVHQLICRAKTCETCSHHATDGLCACREQADMITTPGKCPDWHRQEG